METIKRYMAFVTPYKWKIVLTVLIGVIKFGIPLLLPLISKYVIDNIIGSESMAQSEKVDQLLWIIGGALFLFLVVRPPVEYLRQ